MFRKAKVEDVQELLKIYENARAFMRKTGNLFQWNNAYPNEQILLEDIKKESLYVYEEGEILAVFMFIVGIDPTYNKIDGAWKEDSEYGVIHRVASNGKKKAIFDEVVKYCESKCKHLRIDTHEDNKVMQNAILRNGFEYCGIIYLENGDPRKAYEKI